MKSQDEIVARIEERKPLDPWAFETGEYIQFLDYSNAAAYLNEDTTKAQWDEAGCPKTDAELVETMTEYMEFAWEKANGCRGISASRSLSHYIAWTWLRGDDDLSKVLEGNYTCYGKAKLKLICEHYGWDADQWDDGSRVNTG